MFPFSSFSSAKLWALGGHLDHEVEPEHLEHRAAEPLREHHAEQHRRRRGVPRGHGVHEALQENRHEDLFTTVKC